MPVAISVNLALGTDPSQLNVCSIDSIIITHNIWSECGIVREFRGKMNRPSKHFQAHNAYNFNVWKKKDVKDGTGNNISYGIRQKLEYSNIQIIPRDLNASIEPITFTMCVLCYQFEWQ